MSGLPQELVDQIIDYVNACDRGSLRACSLVCSQWAARSRKHRFAQVKFSSEYSLQRWCSCIRPGPLGPSSLVQDLFISEHYPPSKSYSPAPWLRPAVFYQAGPHLESFSGLRVLEIEGWDMPVEIVRSALLFFGSSCKNVTRLALGHVFVQPSTLAMFVSNFPRLNDLSILDVRRSETRGRDDDLYRGFFTEIAPNYPRGEFRARYIWRMDEPKAVFKAITLLKPRFRKVSFGSVANGAWQDYWPLVKACGEALEELRIHATATGPNCDGLSLACCPNLHTISLSLDYVQVSEPFRFIKKCLSTVTSTHLSKVSFALLFVPDFRLPFWDSLDMILYDLAGQYKPRHEGDKMLVELAYGNQNPPKVENFLQRYGERGTWRMNSTT